MDGDGSNTQRARAIRKRGKIARRGAVTLTMASQHAVTFFSFLPFFPKYVPS